jgi:hypothetical protein
MWPAAAVIAAFIAWRIYENKRMGAWTAERRVLYHAALCCERDAGRLEQIAGYFAREGFPTEAKALRARIELPAIHGETRARWAHHLRSGLMSRRPEGIRSLAAGFEYAGCGASADTLRSWARGLELARMVPGAPPWGLKGLPPWGPSGSAFGLGTIIPSTGLPSGSSTPTTGPVQTPPAPPSPDDAASGEARSEEEYANAVARVSDAPDVGRHHGGWRGGGWAGPRGPWGAYGLPPYPGPDYYPWPWLYLPYPPPGEFGIGTIIPSAGQVAQPAAAPAPPPPPPPDPPPAPPETSS